MTILERIRTEDSRWSEFYDLVVSHFKEVEHMNIRRGEFTEIMNMAENRLKGPKGRGKYGPYETGKYPSLIKELAEEVMDCIVYTFFWWWDHKERLSYIQMATVKTVVWILAEIVKTMERLDEAVNREKREE